MSYLHDNNFQVITMRDLGYEQQGGYLYVKSTEDLSATGDSLDIKQSLVD